MDIYIWWLRSFHFLHFVMRRPKMLERAPLFLCVAVLCRDVKLFWPIPIICSLVYTKRKWRTRPQPLNSCNSPPSKISLSPILFLVSSISPTKFMLSGNLAFLQICLLQLRKKLPLEIHPLYATLAVLFGTVKVRASNLWKIQLDGIRWEN